jgi:large subunit ribosomal protein L9
MKIILREHVEHLGDRGEVVKVAPGYARNYLLPKGLAWLATPGNMKQVHHQRRVWDARDAKEVNEAEAIAKRIEAAELAITVKAGETGTLYGSVTNGDIAGLLAAEGIEIDRRQMVFDPIKAVGSYEIPVKLHRKVSATARLEVVAEADE